ncbi:MAG: transcription-repair coupling factor [Bacillota bacterium]|nr:transcription-repair coupling factor [Bacillota bacterium]
MSAFSEILKESEEYLNVRAAAATGVSPIHVSGVMDAQKAHFIYTLNCDIGKGALIVTPNELTAKRLETDYKVFDPKCVRIKSKELILRHFDAMAHDTLYEKLAALNAVKNASTVIVSTEAFLQLVTPQKTMEEATLFFNIGDTFNLKSLSEKMVSIGYSRAETVEGPGQFSIRGGILDVFSPNSDDPVRIEFFDDEVDSIRKFDVTAQTSIEKLDSAAVIPADDIDETGNILSYIPEDFTVYFDEPLRISEQAKALCLDLGERIKTILEESETFKPKGKYINTYEELLVDALKHNLVSLSTLSPKTPDYKPKKIESITVKSMQPYGGKIEMLMDDILYYQQRKFRIFVMAGSKERIESLKNAFFDKGINASVLNFEDNLPERGTALLCHGSLSGGFEYPLIKTVIISDREIFPEEKKKRKSHFDNADRIKNYAELTPGDYVVHEVHGIGKFTCMQRVEVNGTVKDYLKLLFRGDDVLYVPVSQLDMLHKYKSGIEDGEEKRVKLNKLGGVEWKKTKASVKHNVFELAKKLTQLYAKRSIEQGHAFPEDSNWQREFEMEFEYEETPDQLRCIDEMKEDMQSFKPMDRLLCGDVGFGKTEVAMRGAFKCVTDSMQVAYLVPTTILAAQQYASFVQRMRNYPITVEMLSRFRTKREQADIIKKVRSGEVDILIGTHRILQKDIAFKNLGLLIIDEEQRFGVAHKEAIKELRRDVDVLTLSATPIPRSLHMAMIGIRDMSVLTMPPSDRLPVQTFVMEHNRAVIKEAIDKELSRGGQIFYLYNRVSGIYRVAEEIKALAPEARIAVGHGQMNETELENIMVGMVNGDIDILVCTTIIETGLDIPNVNTIIIEDADRMGLAQLYQLRGRVGRSSRLAYAYLTYKKNKVLDEKAEKRLKAIKEFTEFGSGFKIAMRDLELRGAGNVLGPEQSGFMASVGYEVYCSLLNEAVAELKGEKPETKIDCLVDLDISAFIPENYIKSSVLRIQIYKRIAGIDNLTDSYDVQEELEDRFGDLPQSVQKLIDVALIRSEAAKDGISEISQKNGKMLFFLTNSVKNIPEKISALNSEYKGKVMFSTAGRPCIHLKMEGIKEGEPLEFVKKILQYLKNMV